jgi:CheY-like chemotaxis protein
MSLKNFYKGGTAMADKNKKTSIESVDHKLTNIPQDIWREKPKIFSKKLLQEILAMFVDLGLTAREMKKVSGFSGWMIEEGLKRLNNSSSDSNIKPKVRYSHKDKPYSALIIEYDYIIATDLAHELESRGVVIAGVAETIDGALNIIYESNLDFVVMNVKLKDGLSYTVARKLKDLSIPYAFFTSFEKDEIENEFSGVPHILKPKDSQDVGAFISENFLQKRQ